MDITKRDSKMLKGVAILSMLMLHLFCRKENLPYTPLLWLGNTPLIYYFGLFGDICVAVYCFVSGYAHYLQSSKTELQQRWKRILRFLIPFWIIAVVFSLIGMLIGNAVVPGSMKEFLLNCLTIKNSYNGAWWYANTYILLGCLAAAVQKVRRTLSRMVGVAYGICVLCCRLWYPFLGLGHLRLWRPVVDRQAHRLARHFVFSLCHRNAILQKAGRFFAAAVLELYKGSQYIHIYSTCLCVYDHRPRYCADALCCSIHGDSNHHATLRLPIA